MVEFHICHKLGDGFKIAFSMCLWNGKKVQVTNILSEIALPVTKKDLLTQKMKYFFRIVFNWIQAKERRKLYLIECSVDLFLNPWALYDFLMFYQFFVEPEINEVNCNVYLQLTLTKSSNGSTVLPPVVIGSLLE